MAKMKKKLLENEHLLSNGIMPPVVDRFSKEDIEKVIIDNYGVLTIICSLLDCSFKQFYNAVDKYGLRDLLIESKQQLVGLAECAIVDCLKSKRDTTKLKAAEITLKSLGKSAGWNVDNGVVINQQINTDDKTTEIKNIFGV